MKKIILIVATLFLFSCSGSDAYQGKWKATNENGDKFDITFSSKELTIKDGKGKILTYPYTQHAVEYNNSKSTYGIAIEGKGEYSIHFPSNDETTAFIVDGNDVAIYAIDRNEYTTKKDVYKLN